MTGATELSGASGMLAPCTPAMVTPVTMGSLSATGAGVPTLDDTDLVDMFCPTCRGTFAAPAGTTGGLIVGCHGEVVATPTTI